MPDIAMINGVSTANVAKINGITQANIAKVNGQTIPSGTIGLTADTMQGVLGKFAAVQNATVTTTGDNVQSTFGKFGYVIDNSNVST